MAEREGTDLPEFDLAEGVRVACDPAATAVVTATRWVVTAGFQTQPVGGRARGTTAVESRDEGGDTLRFDANSRVLSDAFVTRPRSVASDPAPLAAVRDAKELPGSLVLLEGASGFAVEPTSLALYDTTLDCFAAVTSHWGEDPERSPPEAAMVSEHMALLFAGGRYVGWRVRWPLDVVCPMSWPFESPVEVADGPRRDLLGVLLYDWMTIDAQSVVRPDLVDDPEDIAHMVGLRHRARALAGQWPESRWDVIPSVARDVAAQVHWAWGFFRVGEG